jgi:hypothetical protein
MRDSGIENSPLATRTWLGTEAKVVRHVRVCGNGYLAAATRIELVRLSIHRDTDYQLPSLHPPLVIACGDSEDDESFGDAARRASEEGSPLLLACIAGRALRIGPLIEPADDCLPWADHTSHMTHPTISVADADRDPRLSLYARLGALLISAQALNFLVGARNQCVLDRVIELNPWSIESKAYKVLKVRQ